MFRFRIILLCLSASVFVACQSKDFNIGSGWLNPNTSMFFIDTCTVKLTTMMIDSTQTSGQKVAFVGKYNDNYTGTVSASSFLELSLPSVDEINKKAIFDSIVVHLTTNAAYFGDTLQNQHVYVHKLKQVITPTSNNKLYNTSVTPIDETPIAEATFKSRPSRTSKSVIVRLPDEMGIDLLNKFKTNAKEVEDNDRFVNYFKGLALLSDDNELSAIMGYNVSDTNFMMRLYYHEVNETRENKKITFTANTAKQYNRIIADRSQTPLNVFNKLIKEVSSSKTNNQAYIATGDGLATRIEFPTIDNLLQIGRFGHIRQALLYIRPVRGSYGPHTPLPPTLNMYILNELNEAFDYIVDNDNNVQTGNLVVDNVYYENTRYVFDITNFLNGQLGAPNNYKYNLQLIIPSSEEGRTIKRLVIGDFNNDRMKDRIQLKITYTSYNGSN